MNKEAAAKKKAEWLAGCLEFGWSKEDLDDLSSVWDQFRDEYGYPRPKTESTTPMRGDAADVLKKHLVPQFDSEQEYDDYISRVDPEVFEAMEAYAKQFQTTQYSQSSGIEKEIEDKDHLIQIIDDIIHEQVEQDSDFTLRGTLKAAQQIVNKLEKYFSPSLLPASVEEQAEKYAEKVSFRVPYDGSDKFHDDNHYKWAKEAYLAGAATRAESGVRKALVDVWRITNALRPFREGIIKEVNDIASKALSPLEPVEDNQDAIGFAEWTQNNHYEMTQDDGLWYKWIGYTEFEKDTYTTTELYNLYKQSK